MKSGRKATTSPREKIKSALDLAPTASGVTWQSVIADAEERMAELRRTLEWAREYGRHRVRLPDPTTDYQKTPLD